MTGRSYTCEACGGSFISEWSEEDAQREREHNFWADTPCGVTCDECYRKITEWASAKEI